MYLCFFQIFFLWLIFSFIALWSGKMYGMTSFFFFLICWDLFYSLWSILENIPCSLEKIVFSAVLRWNVLNISVRSIWPYVSLKVIVSLLIFCLEDLSIDVSGVFRFPTIIVLLSITSFMLLAALCIWPPDVGCINICNCYNHFWIVPFMIM